MEYKISVIIPVYNVEDYIRQSIDSVLNQTYKNLEIILVDDGAKDNSGKICDEYKNVDERIKVIHKINSGVSSARNVGIDIATGKYIMFLDSDDFLEKNACELLYKAIEKVNTEYVMGNYIYTTFEGEKWDSPMFDIQENFEVTITDYKKSFFVMNSVVWNKIFKRDFIETNKLRFAEGALAEDAIFTSFLYTHTDKGYFIKDVILNYRQNKENVSISTNCNKNYFSKTDEAYKLIYENYKTTNNTGFYRFFCARIMPYFLCKIIDTNELKSDEEIIEVLKLFSWYFKQKSEYRVIIMNEDFNEIIDCISNSDYEKAIIKIRKVKEYRNSLNSSQKHNMYAVCEEVFNRMLKES